MIDNSSPITSSPAPHSPAPSLPCPSLSRPSLPRPPPLTHHGGSLPPAPAAPSPAPHCPAPHCPAPHGPAHRLSLTIVRQPAACSSSPSSPASLKYLPPLAPTESPSGVTTSSDTALSSSTLLEISCDATEVPRRAPFSDNLFPVMQIPRVG